MPRFDQTSLVNRFVIPAAKPALDSITEYKKSLDELTKFLHNRTLFLGQELETYIAAMGDIKERLDETQTHYEYKTSNFKVDGVYAHEAIAKVFIPLSNNAGYIITALNVINGEDNGRDDVRQNYVFTQNAKQRIELGNTKCFEARDYILEIYKLFGIAVREYESQMRERD